MSKASESKKGLVNFWVKSLTTGKLKDAKIEEFVTKLHELYSKHGRDMVQDILCQMGDRGEGVDKTNNQTKAYTIQSYLADKGIQDIRVSFSTKTPVSNESLRRGGMQSLKPEREVVKSWVENLTMGKLKDAKPEEIADSLKLVHSYYGADVIKHILQGVRAKDSEKAGNIQAHLYASLIIDNPKEFVNNPQLDAKWFKDLLLKIYPKDGNKEGLDKASNLLDAIKQNPKRGEEVLKLLPEGTAKKLGNHLNSNSHNNYFSPTPAYVVSSSRDYNAEISR